MTTAVAVVARRESVAGGADASAGTVPASFVVACDQ